MWVPIMSFVMGLGAFLISQAIHRLVAGAKIPRSMAEWHSEVEAACFDRIRASIHLAECDHRLEDLIGRVPADFNPTIFSAPAIAREVERASMRAAEQRGLHPKPHFSAPDGEAPSFRFLDGQLIPEAKRDTAIMARRAPR